MRIFVTYLHSNESTNFDEIRYEGRLDPELTLKYLLAGNASKLM